MAVEITNTPEDNKKPIPILRGKDTLKCQSIGTGIARRAASVKIFSHNNIQKFCGRKVQSGPGNGLTRQLSWNLVNHVS
jgi:hypothetical protein